MKNALRRKRWMLLALCLALLGTLILPLTAAAQGTAQKLVRVGRFDSSFNYETPPLPYGHKTEIKPPPPCVYAGGGGLFCLLLSARRRRRALH